MPAPDADDSLEPTTNTSAPQHFDCKDRNSALYPAAASYIACVVLLPLSLAVDPRYSGMKYFREKTWEQKCAIEEKKLLREWRDQQVRISRALAICWQISGWPDGQMADAASLSGPASVRLTLGVVRGM